VALTASQLGTYLGLAKTNPKRAYELGQSTGNLYRLTADIQRRRRLEILAQSAVRKQKAGITPTGAELAAVGALTPAKPHTGGGGFGGIGPWIGRFFSQAGDYAKHLLPGVAELGKSAIHDIFRSSADPSGKSELWENVAKPTAQALAHDVTHPVETIKERPFDALLDALTIGSAGAAAVGRTGSALANAGKISRENPAARIYRTDTRPNLAIEGKQGGLEVPREYSNIPLRKASQITLDKILERPSPLREGANVGRNRLGQMRIEHQINRQLIDRTLGESRAAAQIRATGALKPVREALDKLNPMERIALGFAMRGVNTAEKADRLAEFYRYSARGESPAGLNVAEHAVDPEYASRHADVLNKPEFHQILENPSPEMQDAARVWSLEVEKNQGRVGVDPATQEGNLNSLAEAIKPSVRGNLDEGAEGPLLDPTRRFEEPENYPIERTYVPDIGAVGYEFKEPGRLARMMHNAEPGFERGPHRSLRTQAAESLIERPGTPSFLEESANQLFLSGAARTDPGIYFKHISDRENYIAKIEQTEKLLDEATAKAPDGTPMQFQNQAEVTAQLGKDWVWIDNASLKHVASEEATVEQIVKNATDDVDPSELEALNLGDEIPESMEAAIAEGAAESAIKEPLPATGRAIHRSSFDRFQEHVAANAASKHASLRLFDKAMNKWRAYTLVFMPRWWINTFVGSSTLNILKGVSPRDYYKAREIRTYLEGGGKFDELPPESQRILAQVNLGGIVHTEALNEGAQGGVLGQARITRAGFEKVQSMEDFFRRGSFVQSLDNVAKQHLRETGEVVDSWRNYSRGEIPDEGIDPAVQAEHVRNILEDPELLQKALDDVNKFSYSFSELTPKERQYVRRAVPFWGWYKFVTKLMYRLPVEYPGRAQAIRALGQVGIENESEIPYLPYWVKGAIFLNKDPKNLKYISTFGINPFSDFANPGAAQGGLIGLLDPSQFNPALQALAAVSGYDVLRQGALQQSADTMTELDYLGRARNALTGEQVPGASRGQFRRLIGTLARSVPGVRIAEQFHTGGRPVYPESVPFIAERPIPVGHPDKTDLVTFLGSIVSGTPQTRRINEKDEKSARKYVKSKRHSRLKRERKALKK